MAKKQEKKTELFETVQFQDFKRAQREVSFAKFNLIRIIIGFAIACFATWMALSGFLDHNESKLIGGFFIGVFSYLIGGGIGKAVRAAWKLTVFGWYLIPFFPIDLVLCLCFFILSLYGLAFVPVIFIGLNYIQHKKTLDAAQRYLAESARSVSEIAE